jgi:thiamine transport system permease protein
MGAIALFGSEDFITLPALLYAKLGSYRSTDAAGLALILGVLCLVLMLPAVRSSRHVGELP